MLGLLQSPNVITLFGYTRGTHTLVQNSLWSKHEASPVFPGVSSGGGPQARLSQEITRHSKDRGFNYWGKAPELQGQRPAPRLGSRTGGSLSPWAPSLPAPPPPTLRKEGTTALLSPSIYLLLEKSLFSTCFVSPSIKFRSFLSLKLREENSAVLAAASETSLPPIHVHRVSASAAPSAPGPLQPGPRLPYRLRSPLLSCPFVL